MARDRRSNEIAPKITDPDAERATQEGLQRGMLERLADGLETSPGDDQAERKFDETIETEESFVFNATGRPVFMGSIEAGGDDATVTIEEAPAPDSAEKHWDDVTGSAGASSVTDGTVETYRYDLSGTGLRVTIDPGTGTADFDGVVS